ncbi:hypothetical protein [Staphylococcus arlettae]|uniref:hypothetical protein n=1 Tax=Staphylococcus arlettae TaxID=29378 RepID=UPI001056F339|nr:hypothetical protein [Staphylococcus arlettae]
MAVADCIEIALQTKLVSMLVILAGVGRRNHFFKIRFLSTPFLLFCYIIHETIMHTQKMVK